MRRRFDLNFGDGRQDDLHGAKRAGHHAGFTADTLLLIDLHAIVDVAYRSIRTTAGAGRIFAMVAGHCTSLMLMPDNRDPGLVVTLAKDVLLFIVGQNASDLTGMASQALLAVGHNKTVHGDLLFWL